MIIDISTKIGTTSNQGGFKGLLDVYSGAAAAYSLRKLSKATTSVVRVRRSSDNAEADFTAQEITDGTLTAWVNTDVVRYTSDFTSSENLFESNGTGAAAQSVAGVNDAYKFTLSGGSTTHLCGIFGLQAGVAFTVEFDYYLPSGQTVDAIRFRNLIANTDFNTLDSWTSVSISTTSSISNDAFWQPLASGNVTVNADGDVFYLKNIVITQTTADGLVTTWYDQSGNGNDATQGSAAAQPKIVSAGVLVTENGKPAVDFDGTDDNLDNGTTTYSQPNTVFSVAKFDNIADGKSNAIWGSNITNIVYLNKNTGNQYEINAGSPFNTGDTPSASLALQVGLLNGASSNVWENSVDLGSGNAGGNDLIGIEIGQVRDVAITSFDGKISEIIFYNSDQSTNRSGIEANINKHYNIYP